METDEEMARRLQVTYKIIRANSVLATTDNTSSFESVLYCSVKKKIKKKQN
jgi:hypothetical protein